MCGILGSIGVDVGDSAFRCMLDTIRHRGPDAFEIVNPDTSCQLGHTRLSIIDTSQAGQQPLHDFENDRWAVVNGEIYNHLELRNILEKDGHIFSSNCDSEVVIRGYAAWGDNVLKHLRGIFAFAIYDSKKRRLLLARDAVGVKPLYYKYFGKGILFASELKALLAGIDKAPEVNPYAIWSYLSYRYVPGELTPYIDMHKLLPAHMLVWDNGKAKVSRWWTPRIIFTPKESQERYSTLKNSIDEAVNAQLMSDVPIGILLSGGIDSSAVTALASKRKVNIDTFCCGFFESGYDERSYARMAAKHCNVRLHETIMDHRQLISALPAYIEWFDEPFFDYSAIALHSLCKIARSQGKKVLLAGDGADEIFAGYLWYDDFARYGIEAAQIELERFFSYNGFFTHKMLERLSGRKIDYDHLWLLREYDRPDLSPVNRGQWLDFHTFLPDDILTKVDRASMATGVEIRVPFLDQRLLDECFLLPQQFIYKNGERKYALKRALSSLLPGSLLTKRKKGFGFPLEVWDKPIRALAGKLLRNGHMIAHGYLCRPGVEETLKTMNAHSLWLLLTAELWLRRYIAQEDIRRLIGCRPGDERRGRSLL